MIVRKKASLSSTLPEYGLSAKGLRRSALSLSNPKPSDDGNGDDHGVGDDYDDNDDNSERQCQRLSSRLAAAVSPQAPTPPHSSSIIIINIIFIIIVLHIRTRAFVSCFYPRKVKMKMKIKRIEIEVESIFFFSMISDFYFSTANKGLSYF